MRQHCDYIEQIGFPKWLEVIEEFLGKVEGVNALSDEKELVWNWRFFDGLYFLFLNELTTRIMDL
jgi:hypothetical protein